MPAPTSLVDNAEPKDNQHPTILGVELPVTGAVFYGLLLGAIVLALVAIVYWRHHKTKYNLSTDNLH